MSLTDLNRVQYGGLDFQTNLDDLLGQIQVQFATDFNDFALSSLGIMLLDVVAFGLDTLSFYLDRRATDQYLVTALTLKSVSRITRQLGYKMSGAIASSVDLQVAIQNPQSFSIPIPAKFQFQGPNGLIFEVAQAVTFDPNSGPTDFEQISCYQGQTLTETFVSDGSANQVFELRRVPDSNFVVQGTVSVTVNGTPFTESDFITYDQTNQFEVGYTDDPPTVRFGDGTAGNIPTSGATISVTYVASQGASGQVIKNTIQSAVSPLVVSFTNILLSVNNPGPSVGGDDAETIEHAQAFAGLVYKSRQVAVTLGDYEALAGSFADPLFGRVAVAQAISSRSAASDLELQNQLLTIMGAVTAAAPTVATQGALAIAALTAINADATTISTTLAAIGTNIASILTQVASAISSAQSIKNLASDVGASSQEIQTLVVDGTTAVSAISIAGSSQLTTADADNLTSLFTRINSQASLIITGTTNIQSAVTTQLATLGTIQTSATDVGSSVSAGQLLIIDTAVGDISTQSATANTAVVAMEGAVTDEIDTVSTAVAAISAHVDAILSADCNANLVTVPILAKDSSGFYAAPSSSLINSLQNFLDARCEVTQTVVVTSGVNFLESAVVTVWVLVTTGNSLSVVQTAVSTAIDGVLRGRAFGESLYISELMAAALATPGVSFANVQIQGTLESNNTIDSSQLDTQGNLIITTSQVVTKGATTINVAPAPTS